MRRRSFLTIGGGVAATISGRLEAIKDTFSQSIDSVFTEQEINARHSAREGEQIPIGSAVTFGVEDVNNDTNTFYEWTVVDRPEGSDAELLHDDRRMTALRPDAAGDYTMAIDVSLPDGSTETETFEVTAFEGTARLDLLHDYAPIVHFHEDERFTPTRFEALVENARLRTIEDSEVVREDLTMDDLSDYTSSEHYLEPKGDEADYEEYTDAYPETIYGSVHENVPFNGDEYTALVYWMFYVHDPKPPLFNPTGNRIISELDLPGRFEHTGDQEVVVILLDDSMEPEWIAGQQHFGGEIRRWEKIETTETHPHIYVGLGAHSVFFVNQDEEGIVRPQYQYLYEYVSEFLQDHLENTRDLTLSDLKRVVIPNRLVGLSIGTAFTSIAQRGVDAYDDRIDSWTDIDEVAFGAGYVDYTESGERWLPENIESTDGNGTYQLTVLTGDESWSDFGGKMYTYPNLPTILPDVVSGPRGNIATSSGRWEQWERGEPVDGSYWLEDDVYRDYHQRVGKIETPTEPTEPYQETASFADGSWEMPVLLHNDGPKPHIFTLDVMASPVAEDDTEKELGTSNEYLDTVLTVDIDDETIIDRYSTLANIELPIPENESGVWNVHVELWNYEEDMRDPDQVDLQDYQQYEVTLDPEIKVVITDFEINDQSVEPGENVMGEVVIEYEQGDVSNEFFVGLSAQGPDEEYYDGRGDTVSLEPEETTTVDVVWPIPDDIHAGVYDFTTGVWEESDPDELETVLDREWSDDDESVTIYPQLELLDFEMTASEEDEDAEVTITVTADSDDTQNDRQSIAIGFPDLEGVDEDDLDEVVSIDDHNLETDEDDMVAPPGTELSANYGDDEVVSEYPLVEGWVTDHGPEDDELYLELTVTPAETDEDEFQVQAKTIAATEDWQLVEGDPDGETGDTVDQQGEYVYEETVEVERDADVDWELDVRFEDEEDSPTETTASSGEQKTVEIELQNTGPAAASEITLGINAHPTATIVPPEEVAIVGIEVPDGQSSTAGERRAEISWESIESDETVTASVTLEVAEDALSEEYATHFFVLGSDQEEAGDWPSATTTIIVEETDDDDEEDEELDRIRPPDQELAVQPDTRIMFEVGAVDPGEWQETEWYLDDEYAGLSMGPWHSAYFGGQDADYWHHTFESDGQVTAEVDVDDGGQIYTTSWTIDVDSDGFESPTVTDARPSTDEEIERVRGETIDLEVDVADPDGTLDRVVWWAGAVDVVLDVTSVSGTEDTASISVEAEEVVPEGVVVWVVDENGGFVESDWWSFTQLRDDSALEVSIRETNTPIDAGEFLEVTAEVENTGGESVTREIELIVGHDPELVDTETISLDSDGTETISLGYETPLVDNDQEFPVRVESDDDTDEQTVTVLGTDDDDTVLTVQPGERILFEAEIDDVDSDWGVEWQIDGEREFYRAHSDALTVDYYQYVEQYGSDYFTYAFESTGTYEITAFVFDDVDIGTRDDPDYTQADTERWTVRVTPDGKTQPSVTAADPDPAEPIAVDRDEPFEIRVDISSPDSNLDRAVWWLSQADIILDFHDLDGREETVTLSVAGGEACHTCTISPWIITDDGLLTWPDSWEIDHESAESPATFEVMGIETNSPVGGGEILEVDTTIQNVGDETGTTDVELMIGHDPTLEDSEMLTLEPGESDSLTLTFQAGHPAGDVEEFPVEVDTGADSASEMVVVESDGTETDSEDSMPATFHVMDVTTNSPVGGGEVLEVVTTIQNVGDEAGTTDIELIVGHDPSIEDSEMLTLEPDESVTLTLTFQTGQPAGEVEEFPVVVDTGTDTASATVTVE